MKIILQGKPQSVNTMYATVCRGSFPTRFMSKKGKEVKESYQRQAKSQWKDKPLEGEILVHINLYFNDKRKNDIDNFNKGILDSLTGICWIDDSQICRLVTQRFIGKEEPYVEVFIDSLEKVDCEAI